MPCLQKACIQCPRTILFMPVLPASDVHAQKYPFHVENYVVVLPIFYNFWGRRTPNTATFPSSYRPLPLSKPLGFPGRRQTTVRSPERQEPHWRPFSRLERRGRCSPRPLSSGRACSLLVVLLTQGCGWTQYQVSLPVFLIHFSWCKWTRMWAT